jgi:branched-chain amino acid transport system permease protein
VPAGDPRKQKPLRLLPVSGEAVIFNVKGGIGTLAGPLLGVGVFHSGGVIFVAMVILMPRGLLGFARNWLNS